MPNSNGRIYADNSTNPPKGVSFKDVQTVLGIGNVRESELCTSGKINMWAKCKPIVAPLVRPLDYAHAEQVTNYKCGLTCIMAQSFNSFLSAVRSALNDSNYKFNGEFVAVKYTRPTGGMASIYRISDFDGYNHRSEVDYSIHNESQGGDGLPVSAVYSRNILIDLRGTPQDQDLPDDGARISYYLNFMSGGTQIAAREMMHVYDIINWANTSFLTNNLKRGMLLINEDGYMWATGRLPWSNPDWVNLFGGSNGKPVTCIEFYTTTSYAGGTENKTGTFIAIPQFSYVTKCITNANFSGTYPTQTPSDTIEIFYLCDAAINTFDELYIDLQICYDGVTWEKVSMGNPDYTFFLGSLVLRNSNVQRTPLAVYESVCNISSTERGKKMRLRVWGKLSGNSITRDFYFSEETTID